MSWISIAILAYLLFAVVNLADKFLLEKVIPRAKTYAFLVGTAGLILFVIAPWFLEWPGVNLFVINLLVGACFALALLFLYTSLRDADASRIFTLVGGTVPILIIIFSIDLKMIDYENNIIGKGITSWCKTCKTYYGF